jgi:hypothetical protein
MIAARKVALRINGMRVTNTALRHGENELELVIADPFLGELVINESFTLELLKVLHPHELRSRLPNDGWRRISLRILIGLLGSRVVRVVGDG